ncbi:hypothetical protein Tco_1122210 [Tanacetum coccineum]|uniref:Uncharacterized protein n=1 Tax=Tanacetum coccineum TaxID=301880 RepID=A0ABQ5J1J3_9ASTR
MVLFDIVDMDACHVLLGRPWQSDLNVVHIGKENTYTFSKDGHKLTLCPYSDEVQATTTKVKKYRIMLRSIRNKKKNVSATTIPPDQCGSDEERSIRLVMYHSRLSQNVETSITMPKPDDVDGGDSGMNKKMRSCCAYGDHNLKVKEING